MPSLSKPNFNFNLSLGRSKSAGLVGLDIQPGYVAAVQARVNGSILVQRAVGAPLGVDTMREGEVLDEGALSDTLRELFRDSGLGKRVRVGVANQRTVLRTLELPPLTDRKELAAAVRFQAEDQVPMPLGNAVLDFQPLGVVDTPGGPRQRVVLVAAQRDMVERLLNAVREAGLRPEGVDLSAFALIRSLYRPDPDADPEHLGRVLYLNVGGLTNMAIAEGTICRFTRVVGGGLEAMAAEVAERRSIPLVDARALLASIDLTMRTPSMEDEVNALLAATATKQLADGEAHPEGPSASGASGELLALDGHTAEGATEQSEDELTPVHDEHPNTHDAVAQNPDSAAQASDAAAQASDVEAQTPDVAEQTSDVAEQASDVEAQARELEAQPPKISARVSATAAPAPDADVRAVLENGIREIAGEVRNSLDFHRSQEGGGAVSSVVLSGPALELAGFAEMLEADLGLPLRLQSVSLDEKGASGAVPAHRLAIAAGLAAEEVHS
jgi:type IV pilus assembly protein PilM